MKGSPPRECNGALFLRHLLVIRYGRSPLGPWGGSTCWLACYPRTLFALGTHASAVKLEQGLLLSASVSPIVIAKGKVGRSDAVFEASPNRSYRRAVVTG